MHAWGDGMDGARDNILSWEKIWGGGSNICAVKMVGLLFIFALFINFLRSDYNDIADANSWDKEREIKMKGLLPCAVFLQE